MRLKMPCADTAHARGSDLVATVLVALLSGCATSPPPAADGWRQQTLPGKPLTHYRWTHKEGRTALQADSQQSASLWRKRLNPAQDVPQQVRFSWWVQDLIPQASVAEAHLEDSPARVVFGFDGDRQRLSARNRSLFDLAETLTGEAPPFATLMYVWDPRLPVDEMVVNPRTDRIRKMVVATPSMTGALTIERDILADYQQAFGKPPGRLIGIAIMTDSDNTQGQARTLYGPISIR